MAFHFRYPLQSLKIRRGHELDAAQAELGLAQAEVDVAQRRVDTAEDTMRELETLLRDFQRDGILDLDRHRRAHDYLDATRAQADTLRGTLTTLIDKRSVCVEAVKAGKTALRSLERHEERLSERAQAEHARADQRAADDGWLMVSMRIKRDLKERP